MQGKGYWQPHPTSRGAQPDNVILRDREKNDKAKTPWRYKISKKVTNMLAPAKTKQEWDDPANKDARTFHAFVSGEGGLGEAQGLLGQSTQPPRSTC
jgi:hypothetical protein